MSVTREEVLWCYQNLLGREPESDEAIRVHLDNKTLRDVVNAFTNSEEFRQQRMEFKRAAIAPINIRPLALDVQQIDISASAEELDRCAAKIKDAWQTMGAEQPHFSVLSQAQFLPENLSESIASFWESGENEATHFESVLARYGVTKLENLVCVEYGCGVGRLTGTFAKHFKQVFAYDISKPHLIHASQRIAELGLKNVSFVECLDLMKANIEPCDVFLSIIVLQHNPPPLLFELIRRALIALRPGGTAIFQVPIYIVGYSFNLKNWLETNHAHEMQMHCVPQESLFELVSGLGCKLLSVREDAHAGHPEAIVSNTFVVRKD